MVDEVLKGFWADCYVINDVNVIHVINVVTLSMDVAVRISQVQKKFHLLLHIHWSPNKQFKPSLEFLE